MRFLLRRLCREKKYFEKRNISIFWPLIKTKRGLWQLSLKGPTTVGVTLSFYKKWKLKFTKGHFSLKRNPPGFDLFRFLGDIIIYEKLRNPKLYHWSFSVPLRTTFWICLKFASFSVSVSDELMHSRKPFASTWMGDLASRLWLPEFNCEQSVVKRIQTNFTLAISFREEFQMSSKLSIIYSWVNFGGMLKSLTSSKWR